LAALPVVSTQELPQRVSRAAQPAEHRPCEQTWLFTHTVPQAPQLAESDAVSVHVPPHDVWPTAQPQTPLRHA
jgi:hypothetical protein